MGITKECFKHYETIVNNDIVDFKKCSVVELGSQTVHFYDKKFLKDWSNLVNVPSDFAEYMYDDITGYEMHGLLGHKYHCIDFDDFGGKVKPYKIDLNTATCPRDLYASANIVTNFGTTEHLINQANAFKLIHEIAKPWAAMIHVLPMARWNHGFFNYNPVFFTSLAHANKYKIVTLCTSRDLQHNVLQDLVPYVGQYIPFHEYIHVIFVKTTDDAFKMPAQIYLNGRYI